MNWAAVFWLTMIVVFLMAEASTVTLVSLWFAAGSLAAMLVALTGAGIGFQVTVFVIVAAVCLTALRPWSASTSSPSSPKPTWMRW